MTESPAFRFFRYHPPVWSVGDWLELQLESPDEPSLRSALEPLGLAGLASTKIGPGRAEAFGVALAYRVFGTTVSLVIGPEDRYAFLEPRHFEQARRMEDAIARGALERFVVAEPVDLPDDADEATPRVPPARRRDAERAAARMRRKAETCTVAVGARTAGRWTTRMLRPARAGGAVTDVEITPESACFDAATGARLDAESLAPETIARVVVGIGRRADGSFGAIASRFDAFFPDEALLSRVRRWQEPLARLGVALEPPDAATYAALHLVDAAEGRDVPIERDLADELLFARHALPPASAGRLATVVALLRSLRELGFPLLFAPREALAAGESEEALRARLLAEANRGAAAAGDARRWTTTRVEGHDEPAALLLAEADRRVLAEAGLASSAGAIGVI